MKLTVIKTTYGTHERPVIQLDYHDGGEMPTYDIGTGMVDVEIFDRIQYALNAGCEVEYEGFEKYIIK